MASKKIKKEIIINQQTGEISPIKVLAGTKRLFDTSDAKVSEKIAAVILAEEIADELKTQIDNIRTQIAESPYEDVCKALVDEGVISEGEIPVFTVINKTGKKISKQLVSNTTKTLNMDAFKDAIKDPAVFKALPDEYKKIDIQGKPFFTQLYKAGAIDPLYEPYFSVDEKTETSFKSVRMEDKA